MAYISKAERDKIPASDGTETEGVPRHEPDTRPGKERGMRPRRSMGDEREVMIRHTDDDMGRSARRGKRGRDD